MLCELPDDVLVHIFAFLPSVDQILTIPRVCMRLKVLVATKSYWRTRFVHMCARQPVTELSYLRLWQEACMQRELALAAATKCATEGSTVLQGTLGEVDCVHILRSELYGTSRMVAGGARDACVYVWRKRPTSGSGVVMEGIGSRRMREFTMATLTGHRGWVWSLASERDHRPQLLCSGSWDHNIRMWDVSIGECVGTIDRYHKAAILSLCIPERDTLISGCLDKKVRVMDLRQPTTVQAEHSLHKRPVLSIAAAGDYVYSGSEDSTVCVWDRRNTRMLQRLQVFTATVLCSCLESYLQCTCTITPSVCKVQEEEEVIQRHEVYLYRCSTGSLEQMEHFTSGHSQPITSVLHSHGMLATASKDGSVQLYTPGAPPTPWTVLHRHHGAITDLDFYTNALAVAKGRGVALWTP